MTTRNFESGYSKLNGNFDIDGLDLVLELIFLREII